MFLTYFHFLLHFYVMHNEKKNERPSATLNTYEHKQMFKYRVFTNEMLHYTKISKL